MKKEPKLLKHSSMNDIWERENTDFTPWLSKHLDELGDSIGLSLNFVDTEVKLGNLHCDILATEGISDQKVIIENKFNELDHRHIGQGVTYLANANAKTVIWVCEKYSDEHLLAIQSLNEMTDETYSFYAVRINTYKVQDQYYYDFNVDVKPNYFAKRTVNSKTSLRYYNFWQELASLVDKTKFHVKVHGRSYNDFRLPVKGLTLGTSLSNNTQDVYFWTFDAELYDKFSKFMKDNADYNMFIQKDGVKNPNCKIWVFTRPEQLKELYDMNWTVKMLEKAYEIASKYHHSH